jgi:hypothetical protein
MLLKTILVLAIILIVRDAKEAGGVDNLLTTSGQLIYLAVGVVGLLVILDKRGRGSLF